MGRELEKRMGGYGVGPMPVRGADESPVRKAPVEGEEDNADLEEGTGEASLSPKKTPALGRAALNKSQSAMKLNSLMN